MRNKSCEGDISWKSQKHPQFESFSRIQGHDQLKKLDLIRGRRLVQMPMIVLCDARHLSSGETSLIRKEGHVNRSISDARSPRFEELVLSVKDGKCEKMCRDLTTIKVDIIVLEELLIIDL